VIRLLLALLALQEDPARLRGLLRERLEAGRGTALAAGIVGPGERIALGEGSLRKGAPGVVDGDTIFEIGSITKTFTALLLADLVRRGDASLDDPVAKHLPADFRIPSRGDRPITLIHLAQHRSGLPRMPANFFPADPANPYADYSTARLRAFLDTHELVRTPGTFTEYSNLGAGLLGQALAHRAGRAYEDLVLERLARPLGMGSTSIAIPPEHRVRLAAPHDDALREVKNWDLGALPGAGALRSTVSDLLRYIALYLDSGKDPLSQAAAETLKPRAPAGQKDLEIALGWHVFTGNGRTIFAHNGGTGGYRAFAGFDRDARRGVVVLGNSTHSVDDLGMHLLDPKRPLKKVFKPVDVDPLMLDRHVGRYALAPGFVLSITREGSRLFGQATGQERFPLAAASATEFRYEEADLVIEFVKPGSMRFRQGGPALDVQRLAD
jgi:CubicO group peptidase (beta-lactamase class C family)